MMEYEKKGMNDWSDLRQAIIDGDANAAKSITMNALELQYNPELLIKDFMIPAMDEVGRKFETYEYFVPELMLSARAMKSALELLRPLLIATGSKPVATVVIGTVLGDVHDIGKNIVAAMLEGGGFEVIDVGTDVSSERFIEAIRGHHASILAMSALITTTMIGMRTVIERLTEAGLREHVRVMIGGAPITDRYALEIGADGYHENASGAVTVARRLIGITQS